MLFPERLTEQCFFLIAVVVVVVDGLISSGPTNQAALEGESVTLSCTVAAPLTSSDISWLFDSMTVAGSCSMPLAGYTVTSAGLNGCDLTITSLDAMNAGLYECEDSFGFIEHATVSILDPPTTTMLPTFATASTFQTCNCFGNTYTRTIIFIKSTTSQDIFLRGGVAHSVRSGCTADASTSPCAIDISVYRLGTTSHYDKYNAWKVNDDKFDLYGAQPGQGTYIWQAAEGTPTVETSNNMADAGYQALNKYGDDYFMVNLYMDCTDTENGWFDVKGYMTGGTGWENDITQGSCSGTAGGTRPYPSDYHGGRCGYVNVFWWDSNACTIDLIV